jgi:hypothetical protein
MMKIQYLLLLVGFSVQLLASDDLVPIESMIDELIQCEAESGSYNHIDLALGQELKQIKGVISLNETNLHKVYVPAIVLGLFEDDGKFAYKLDLYSDPDDTETIRTAMKFYYRGSYKTPRLKQTYQIKDKIAFSIVFDKEKQLALTRISKRKKTLKVPFWSSPTKLRFHCQSSQAELKITHIEYAKAI